MKDESKTKAQLIEELKRLRSKGSSASAVSNQQSAISNQQSAISNQQSDRRNARRYFRTC